MLLKGKEMLQTTVAIFFFFKHTGQTMLLVIPEIYIRKHQSEAGETQQAPLCGQLTAP